MGNINTPTVDVHSDPTHEKTGEIVAGMGASMS